MLYSQPHVQQSVSTIAWYATMFAILCGQMKNYQISELVIEKVIWGKKGFAKDVKILGLVQKPITTL